MGKCISKLIYWWNIMYHKGEIKLKYLKKYSGWHSGQTLEINWKVLASYVKLQSYQKWLIAESSKILIEEELNWN